MTKLDDYISSTWLKRWQWGVNDCTMWVSDWCKEAIGIDVMLSYRGDYSSYQEVAALIEAMPISRRISLEMEAAGIPVTDAPFHPGDVGVISVGGAETAAIFDGALWVCRYMRGIGRVDCAPVIAWRVSGGS